MMSKELALIGGISGTAMGFLKVFWARPPHRSSGSPECHLCVCLKRVLRVTAVKAQERAKEEQRNPKKSSIKQQT